MDTREAIDVIRLMKHQLDRDVTIYDGFLFEALTQVIEKQHEALDLAIEALRGDFHCPKCGTIVRDDRQCHDLVYRGEAEVTDTDLISRQAAIEALLDHVNIPTQAQREYAVEIFENIPPVEPKPPVDLKPTETPLVFGENAEFEFATMCCEDCISRADIEYHTQLEARGNGQYEEVEVAYKSDIESLPPVEPERPKGEWVGEADGYWNGELIYDVWYCPFCDYRIEEEERELLPHYCPNCGADMRGEE